MIDLSAYAFVLPNVLTGLTGWIAATWVARSNEKIARIRREDEDRTRVAAAKVTAADDLTHRFKVLMDGYEARIRDLTIEVTSLRFEVAELRAELSERDHRRQHDGTD